MGDRAESMQPAVGGAAQVISRQVHRTLYGSVVSGAPLKEAPVRAIGMIRPGGLFACVRVGSEDLDQRAMFLESFEGFAKLGIFAMAG